MKEKLQSLNPDDGSGSYQLGEWNSLVGGWESINARGNKIFVTPNGSVADASILDYYK